MAALRLVRKWGVPVATAAAIPILTPVVFADSGKKEDSASTSRMVRPSELPIYEEPEELLDFEYHGKERTSLEENVGVVRKEIEGVLEATRAARERTVQIYETGKAHTIASMDMMKDLRYSGDEENILPRAGAITIGGLAGLVIGARKKGGFVKKVLYTSTGIVSAASLCYPRQAYQISQNVYGNAKDYATIGYNFVAGVKPQSKVSTPVEPVKEIPATAAEDVTPVPTMEDSPTGEASAPPTESEGAEVRSVIPQILPSEKSSAQFDLQAQQSSDVTQWGFRLIDRSDTDSSSQTDVVLPAEPTVPEGFGSVEEINKDTVETEAKNEVTEKYVDLVKEVSLPEPPELAQTEELSKKVVEVAEDLEKKVSDAIEEKVVDVEEKVVDVIEERVADVEEKVADVVEEKVADDVEEKVADVEEKVADVVEKVADVIEEKVVDVVEEKVADVEEKFVDVVEERVADVEEKVADVVEERVADVEEKVVDVVEEKVADVEEKVVDVVEEKVADVVEEKVADVEEKVAEVVEEKVLDVEEKVADVIEEKIADVEEKVADVVEEKFADVVEDKVADVVEDKVADVVEDKVASIVEKKVADIVEEKVADVEEKVADVVEEKVAGVVEEKVAGVVEEKVADVVEEKVVDVVEEKFADAVEEKIVDIAENVAHIAVEKVADIVEEKVAAVVVDAAQEVEKDAEKVAETAEVAEEVGSKVESALDIVETVAEAAVKAAHDTPDLPEPVIEKAEIVKHVIEETEKVVDNITHIMEKVEEVAEEIKKEAEVIEAQAIEIMQSEGKREEIFEKIVESVTGSETPSTDEMKEASLELPDTDVKETVSEEVKETSEITPEESVAQLKTSENEEKRLPEEPEKKLLPDSFTKEPPLEVEDISSASLEKKGLFNRIISFFTNEKTVPFDKPVGEPVAEKAKEPVTDSTVVTETVATVTEKKEEEILKDAESEVKIVEGEALSSPIQASLLKEEETPDSIGEVLEPVMETVAKDVIVDIAEDALETAAEVVKETAGDVIEAVSSVAEVTDVIEEVGEKIVSVLDAIENVTEEIQESPGISNEVAFKANIIKKVSEGVELVVDAVTYVADKVEDVAETVKEEALIIESQAAELMQSEEKREELVEKVIEYATGTESASPDDVKDVELSTLELKDPVETVVSKEVEQEGSTQEKEPEEKLTHEALTEDIVSKPVIKEGLFDKLVRFFSKDEEKDIPAGSNDSVAVPLHEPTPEELKESSAEPAVDLVREEVLEKMEEPDRDTSVAENEKEKITDKLASSFSEDEEKEVSSSSIEVKEPASELLNVEVKEQVTKEVKLPVIDSPVSGEGTEGLVDKLAGLFFKEEKKKTVFEQEEVPPVAEETKKFEELSVDAGAAAEPVNTVNNEILKDSGSNSTLVKEPDQPETVFVSEETSLLGKIANIFSTSKEESLSAADTGSASPVVGGTDPVEAVDVLSADEMSVDDIKAKEQSSEPDTLDEEPKEQLAASSIVEKAEPSLSSVSPLAKREGLFDRFVNLISKDEDKKDLSVADAGTKDKEDVLEADAVTQEKKDASAPDAVAEDKDALLSDVVTENKMEEPTQLDIKTELSSELDIHDKEPEQQSVVSPIVETAEPLMNSALAPVKREGLFDKLVNLLNKDEDKKDSSVADVLPEDKKHVSVSDVVIEVKESASVAGNVTNDKEDISETDAVTEDKKDTLTENKIEESPQLDIKAELNLELDSQDKEPEQQPTVPRGVKREGLFDKLVNLLSKNEGKEGVSPADNVLDNKKDILEVKEEEKSSDQDNVRFQEPIGDASLTRIEKEGLVSKISSIFSKDDREKAVPAEENAPASEVKELEEKSTGSPLEEVVEPVNDAVISKVEKEGLFDKFASILSKDETKDVTVEKVSDDDSSAEELKESSLDLPDHQEVKELNVELEITEADIVTPTEDRVGTPTEDRVGLFNKLASLFSKEGKDMPGIEKMEESHTDAGKLNEQTSAKPEEVSDISNKESSTPSFEQPDATVPEKISLLDKIAGVFTDDNKKPVFVQSGDASESSEAVESSADFSPEAASSCKPEDSEVQSSFVMVSDGGYLGDKPVSDSSVSASGEILQVPSESSDVINTEEPVLEVKNKGLFDRLVELVSVDDKKSVLASAESESDVLHQTEAVSQDTSAETNADSYEMVKDSEKTSLLDRVTNLFTKKESPADVEKIADSVQSIGKMPSEITEQSENEEVIADNDETFVVKAEPSSIADVENPDDSGQQRDDAASSVWRGWFRTGASVKQEGKDVIVQLTPPPPPVETDYGQSNPEDSDMYTTRS